MALVHILRRVRFTTCEETQVSISLFMINNYHDFVVVFCHFSSFFLQKNFQEDKKIVIGFRSRSGPTFCRS